MDVMELLTSTLIQGLIYALISYGVYITYSILDFPDLGVDGTFPLGAAVTAVLMTKGVDPWLTLPASLIVGGLAGLFTGLVHVKLKVRNLLAGIITMTALFSVNLQIAGSNLTIDRGTDTIFTSAPVMALFGDLSLSGRKLIVSLALVIVIKLLLDAYFHTKSGLLLRAAGLEGTDYTTFLENLRQTLPVITAMGVLDCDGNWYKNGDETPYDELLNEYNILEYNNAFGGNGKSMETFTLNIGFG